jgi:putative SOS response-associated peptidase YedK
MINARAESIAEKPAYRTPFRKHRCLIPADGFYEWHVEKFGKQPYFIHRDDSKPLVFAAVWDHWQDNEGDRIDSCSIITCDANRQMQTIHERMPVILQRRQWDDWLNDNNTLRLKDMLVPYPHEHLEIYPVSLRVNSPTHNGAELIKPVHM